MPLLQNANLSDRSGFTLIEFTVAVLIMMVGLLGLLQAVNMASEHNLSSSLRNEAISLADEQMVAAKNLPFASLAADSSYVNRKHRAGFRNYSVVRTVSTTQTTAGSASSQEVTVRVSWRYKNNKLSHVISTLITN